VGVYSDPTLQVVRYADGNVIHYIITLFACRILRGTLQICAESLAFQFFDPGHLPGAMVAMHRMLVQDALAIRPAPFIR
jgi:hypothetical protein